MSALRECRPEQSWQDREWWHWLLAPSGEEVLGRWHLNGDGETWVWAMPGHGAGSADFMLRHGYRYFAPVEVEALWEHAKACSDAHNIMLDQRDAARAELATLRARVERQSRIMATLLQHAASAPLTDDDMAWARAQVAALEDRT